VAGDGDGALLLCDKPAGITSHDLVARVRRERGCKAGHAGTLDPFATGLLLVLLGRATRVQRFLTGLPKTYLATARLGWRSSTGDPDGELSESGRLPASLELPSGKVRQRVPMTPEREVDIYRAELLGSNGERARYEIECSAGTYIRTLVETLGDAYCEELRRTAIGPFSIEDAGTELDLDQVGALVPAAAEALR
jgi:tRNA pseudouridine55 synthase